MPDFLHQNAAELAEDAQRLLVEFDRDVPGAASTTGECRPPIDVVETTESIEVIVDVPGIPASCLRVLIRGSAVLVVGVKMATPETGARFHVAERSYGRFARVVRVNGAVDTSRARAVTAGGQLRVWLPRIAERRGQAIGVPVEQE